MTTRCGYPWLIALTLCLWGGCSDAPEGTTPEGTPAADAGGVSAPVDTASAPDGGPPSGEDALDTLAAPEVTPSPDIAPSVDATPDERGPADALDEGEDTEEVGLEEVLSQDAVSDGDQGLGPEDSESLDGVEDSGPMSDGALEDSGSLDVASGDTSVSDVESWDSEGGDVSLMDGSSADADQEDSDDGAGTTDPCDLEGLVPSNEGCVFTAVSTANPDLDPIFHDDFAVVVANRDTNPLAVVEVRQGDLVVATGQVPPGETLTLSLPMVDALAGAESTSVLVPQAAYEITSSVPVTATQFSPLHFQEGEDFSMSNDASLLLPHQALTGSYVNVGFPAWAFWFAWRTGFIAIAAIEDDTTVSVSASGAIAQGAMLDAMAPGESQSLTLQRGDVLQLMGWAPEAGVDNQITPETCDGPGWQFAEGGLGNACEGADLHLSGTTIEASAPVAVFTGHSCLRVPFDAHACDHVEEQLFPSTAWGNELVLSAPQRPDDMAAAMATYRIVARDADTTVAFTPALVEPVTLGAGEAVTLSTDLDLRVAASAPILGMIALHSAEGLEPPAMDGSLPLSDPSVGLVVPLRQARQEYVFLTPDTFQSDWVNVVALVGSQIVLDDAEITNWTPISGTPYQVARVPVTPGSHRAHSLDAQSFTLMSYGHANHTSYLYPAGLNLDP